MARSREVARLARLEHAIASVHGTTEPGFEAVREAFERNLTERGELGAAFAVYHRGRKVVDLWGGHLDTRRQQPWREDTVTTVFSTTKGIAALTESGQSA